MSASGYSNLQLRIMSALVLAAAVLLLTWIGGLWFRLLAAAIAGAMFYEWISMTPGSLKIGRSIPMAAFLVVVAVLISGFGVWTIIGIALVAGAVAAVMAETRGQGAWVAKGFAYASLSGIALSSLRADSPAGLVAILFLFAVVWGTDIAAYFVGRSFGGPKLAPSISPGKTWSGAVGGAAGGVAGGMAVMAVAGAASYAAFVIALVLSIVSQIGDLFESSVKRQADVKDSSNLIPGHGGVMDRVDGLVAAAIALYVIGAVGGNVNHPAMTLF